MVGLAPRVSLWPGTGGRSPRGPHNMRIPEAPSLSYKHTCQSRSLEHTLQSRLQEHTLSD